MLSIFSLRNLALITAAAVTVAWSVYWLALEIWCWAYGLLYY